MYPIEKLLKTAVPAAVALSVFSCGVAGPEVEGVPGNGEKVPVTVSVPPSGTRLLDTAGESTVNSIQVFVFSADGRMEIYASGEGTSVSFDCTSGQKEFLAVANAPSLEGLLTREEVTSAVSSLMDNTPSGLVMSGSVSKSVSMVDQSVEIPVARLVARISVKEITNGLSTPGYSSSPVELVSIYLSDVAGTCPYFGVQEPSSWINRLGEAENLSSLLHSGILDTSIAHGETCRTPHYFYCYPNPVSGDSSSGTWCPRFTRIVIAAEIKGETFYYPVAIGNIEANHTYDIEHLQINRLGADSPVAPLEVGSVSVSVKVKDWETGAVTDVTI